MNRLIACVKAFLREWNRQKWKAAHHKRAKHDPSVPF